MVQQPMMRQNTMTIGQAPQQLAVNSTKSKSKGKMIAAVLLVTILLGSVFLVYHRESRMADTNNDDSDGDGIFDRVDNCVQIYNPEQLNFDNDFEGDECDDDDDNDYVLDVDDNEQFGNLLFEVEYKITSLNEEVLDSDSSDISVAIQWNKTCDVGEWQNIETVYGNGAAQLTIAEMPAEGIQNSEELLFDISDDVDYFCMGFSIQARENGASWEYVHIVEADELYLGTAITTIRNSNFWDGTSYVRSYSFDGSEYDYGGIVEISIILRGSQQTLIG